MYCKPIVTGLAAAGLTATAWAHSGATGVVKERMDAMKEMREAVKRIKPMMSGEAAYDADVVRAAARVIDGHAGDALTAQFPEGSVADPSEALPGIWTDWSRFATLARQLSEAARGLEMAAGNGVHGAGHMMGDTGHMMGDGAGMMGGMMGGGLSGAAVTADHLGQMPADGAFVMMTQVCSACHDRFRKDD